MLGVDSDLFLDVSVIHTLAPSYSGTTPAQQLKARDSSKFNKYGALCLSTGDDFRAFALTTFGVLSEQAKHVLERLSLHHLENSDASSKGFLLRATNEILVALHIGNARLLRQGRRRAVF